MEEWKTYTLGELSVDGKGSYGIGAPAVEYSPNKYTYLRITDINDDGTLAASDRKSVGAEGAENYILKENDIVFARTGNSTGRAYFYDSRDGELVYAGFLIKFSLDPNKVNPKILKYYTHSKPYYDWVRSFDSGATRGNINAQTFASMPIELPSRTTQDRIVDIMSAIDDKIRNNNRINHNLEEQAQALYKSWFIDFEPFKDGKFFESELGMIPEGWLVGTVEDLSIRIASGGTPKSMNAEYYSGHINWFSTKELKDGFLFSSEKHITTEAVNNSAAKVFPARTVLMAIYAAPTVGRLGILSTESTFNQAAVGIIPQESVGAEYIYLTLLSERNNLNNLASGAAQQNLNVGFVKNYKVIVPPASILDSFRKMVTPLFDTVQIKSKENLKLETTRDSLLNHLLSSELTC